MTAERVEPTGSPWASAVEQAYREHKVTLLRFVRWLAKDRGLPESTLDADGVVQETFVLALQHWPTIRYPLAWLKIVASRLVSKAQAEVRRCGPADTTALNEPTTSQWTSVQPRASVEDAVFARLVMADICNITSEKQREAVYRHIVEGCSHKQIAEFLGCAPATAQVHKFRGMQDLRKKWTGLLHHTDATSPRWSDWLAAAALVILVWAALSLLLFWLGTSVIVAFLGPLILASGWWATWKITRRHRRDD